MTDHATHDAATELSPAGRARKTTILAEARRAQRGRVRRRRATQAAGATVVIAIVAGSALMTMPRHGSPAPSPTPAPGGPIASAPSRIELVTTDASTYERVVSGAHDAGVREIDDRELLALLGEAGHDVGLIRTQGRVHVVGEEVDAWRIDAPDESG